MNKAIMCRTIRFAVGAMLLDGFAATATAGDLYVAVGGGGDGSSAESPLATVAAAVASANAAIDGGEAQMTIHLAEGTYTEKDLSLTKAITIVGEGDSRTDVIVQASATAEDPAVYGHRVFRLSHADAMLANLTVRNGWWVTKGKGTDSGANGGNVLIYGGGTVTNCVLDSGRVEHTADGYINGALGGNLYIYGNGLVVDCDIANGIIQNSNNCGGGCNVVLHGDGGRLLRCIVRGGRRANGASNPGFNAAGGSGIYMNGACVAENCLITGNSGTTATVALFGGACRLVNCTVAGNTGSYHTYKGVWVNSSLARVVNCVIYDNGGTAASEWGNANPGTFVNCAVPMGCEIIGGTGNIGATDLAFANSATQDYHPSVVGETAVLLAAGTSVEDYAQFGAISTVDLDGQPRWADKCLDIGCYAAVLPEGDLVVRGTTETWAGHVGETTVLSSWTVGDVEGEVTYHWDFGDGETLDTTEDQITHRFDKAGRHPVTVFGTTATKTSEIFEVGLVFIAAYDYYVSPAGADEESRGLGEDAPFASIGYALQQLCGRVQGGDPLIGDVTIHLAAGTYQECDLNLTTGIRIVGEGVTRDDVIVQASGTSEDADVRGHRVFRLAHADAVLANLTVRNGYWVTRGSEADSGANGGNVLIYGGGTVTNCVLDSGFVEHTADALIKGALGGNLYIYGNGLAVDCAITNGIIYNFGAAGGGGNVVLHGGGRLLRCRVTGGRRSDGAISTDYSEAGGSGVYMNGACVAENCLIQGNSGTRGAVALFAGECRLVNCTVVGNSNLPGGYNGQNGVWVNSALARAVNCVIYDNGGTSVAEWGGVNAGAFVNCAVPTGCEITGGTGNVCATDFAFVNLDVSDYRPVRGTEHSVLAGAGTSVADYAAYGGTSATDLNGNPRWTDGSLDIGCCVAVQPGEHQPLIVRGEAKTLVGYVDTTIVLSSSSTGEAGDEVTYHWDFGDGETLDTTENRIAHSYAKAGHYAVTIFGTTATKTSETFEVGQIHILAPDYFVAPDGVDAEGRGLTADDPFASIRFALRQVDAVGMSDMLNVTIHLAPGTYQEWDLNVAEDIRIVGEGATRGDVIVQARPSLDDQSAQGHRVFRLAHAGAMLANLTVRYGYWMTKGRETDSGANGGNVLVYGGGTVTNCVLDSGVVIHSKDALIKGALGGNLYIYGNGLAVDCDIVNGIIWNPQGSGGGCNVVLHGDGGRLLRCRVTGGHRLDYWPEEEYGESGGSGIYMNGACVAESCLVQGNADTIGAVALFDGACRLVNCTVVGNSNTSEFYHGRNGVWVNSSAARVINCVIYGNGGTDAAEWGGVNESCFDFCAFPAECTAGSDSQVVDQDGFVDFAGGNYRIAPNSPLVNHGSAAAEYPQTGAVSPTDLDGNPRIRGRRLDIGCYELPQQKGLILLVE